MWVRRHLWKHRMTLDADSRAEKNKPRGAVLCVTSVRLPGQPVLNMKLQHSQNQYFNTIYPSCSF